MNQNKQRPIVCFFAREHGLNGLEALLESGRYNIYCVFTHKKKANHEASDGKLRSDYEAYRRLCKKKNIPLYTVDSKDEALRIDGILNGLKPFDFIASISWRRLIPVSQLEMASRGGINLHRGKLPRYKGAFPLARAIEAQDEQVYITAHILSEEIDDGDVLKAVAHPVNFQGDQSIHDNVERLKKEITPHFGPLLLDTLQRLQTDDA